MDAISLSVTTQGEGEPVVLVHSSGMSSRQWTRVARTLAAKRRVLAVDLIGSGESPAWPAGEPFHFSADVEAVARVVEAQGEPVHLVGHSYGGLLALTVARTRPARVRSLAVYDPVAFGVLHAAGDAEGLADLARSENEPLFTDDARGGSDAWFELFVDYWNGPGAWRALPAPVREGFLRVGRQVFLEVTSLMHDRTPAEAYAVIDAPTLLLGGAHSPPGARRVIALLAEAMPRARVLPIDGAGHMGPITNADGVATALVAHLDGAR